VVPASPHVRAGPDSGSPSATDAAAIAAVRALPASIGSVQAPATGTPSSPGVAAENGAASRNPNLLVGARHSRATERAFREARRPIERTTRSNSASTAPSPASYLTVTGSVHSPPSTHSTAAKVKSIPFSARAFRYSFSPIRPSGRISLWRIVSVSFGSLSRSSAASASASLQHVVEQKLAPMPSSREPTHWMNATCLGRLPSPGLIGIPPYGPVGESILWSSAVVTTFGLAAYPSVLFRVASKHPAPGASTTSSTENSDLDGSCS